MTLGPNVARLVSLGSDALSPYVVQALGTGPRFQELVSLLKARNGFFAFESALHVRGSGPAVGDLEEWNSAAGWRGAYEGLANDGLFFFAEDTFGSQFAIQHDRIVTFDPETAESEDIAATIDEFAAKILGNVNLLTGYPLAREWQLKNGPLRPGERLIPKIPFVLGGDFEVDNLYAASAAAGMKVRAELAVQIRDFPDGTKFEYRVIE